MKPIIAALVFTLTLASTAQARSDRAVFGALLGGIIAHELSQGSPNQGMVTASGAVIGYEIMRDRPQPNWHGSHSHQHRTRACDAYRVPVYDHRGRIIEYIQHCR